VTGKVSKTAPHRMRVSFSKFVWDGKKDFIVFS
jgi:hypothetical protein